MCYFHWPPTVEGGPAELDTPCVQSEVSTSTLLTRTQLGRRLVRHHTSPHTGRRPNYLGVGLSVYKACTAGVSGIAMQALHGHRHSTLVLPSLGLGFSSESLPSQRRPTAHRQWTHKQSICRAVLSPEKPVLKVALNSALTYPDLSKRPPCTGPTCHCKHCANRSK